MNQYRQAVWPFLCFTYTELKNASSSVVPVLFVICAGHFLESKTVLWELTRFWSVSSDPLVCDQKVNLSDKSSPSVLKIKISSWLAVNLKEAILLCTYNYLLYYAVVTQHINRCIITTGCIRLHVSAVPRPSSGQQGIVLIKVHSLAFLARHCLLKKISALHFSTLIFNFYLDLGGTR